MADKGKVASVELTHDEIAMLVCLLQASWSAALHDTDLMFTSAMESAQVAAMWSAHAGGEFDVLKGKLLRAHDIVCDDPTDNEVDVVREALRRARGDN